MAKTNRQKKRNYLITNSYQVLVMFKQYIFALLRLTSKANRKSESSLASKNVTKANLLIDIEKEPALIVKAMEPMTTKNANDSCVNYNVYFLPSPRKKIPVLKDASNELLRTSRFSVEYHKYLQKEFLEFAHE